MQRKIDPSPKQFPLGWFEVFRKFLFSVLETKENNAEIVTEAVKWHSTFKSKT